jgi:[ribosomal protein S5]-alanine N-acetyltransferase
VNVLSTLRLSLRRLTEEDAEFILELLNDPAFIRFIGDKGVRNLDDARGYILTGPIASYEKHGFGLWLVALKGVNTPVGICGLLKRESLSDVDLGFAFLPAHRAQGYALESAAAVLEYSRTILGLERIVAIVDPDNAGSLRLLEKIGMSFERMIRLSEDGPDIRLLVINFSDHALSALL